MGLGGNCKTTFIATISGSADCYDKAVIKRFCRENSKLRHEIEAMRARHTEPLTVPPAVPPELLARLNQIDHENSAMRTELERLQGMVDSGSQPRLVTTSSHGDQL